MITIPRQELDTFRAKCEAAGVPVDYQVREEDGTVSTYHYLGGHPSPWWEEQHRRAIRCANDPTFPVRIFTRFRNIGTDLDYLCEFHDRAAFEAFQEKERRQLELLDVSYEKARYLYPPQVRILTTDELERRTALEAGYHTQRINTKQ